MDADGTLRLMFRSEEPSGIAEALRVVPPGSPDYAKFLKHLGGLKPGESKPIPPFPAP
jgi:hypothetical protein